MVIELYKKLSKHDSNPILRQLLKSATSIGANVNEASAGQTKRDFISKMAIASKEARETLYWIRLLNDSNWYNTDLRYILDEPNEIVKILTKIAKTSQDNLKNHIKS